MSANGGTTYNMEALLFPVPNTTAIAGGQLTVTMHLNPTKNAVLLVPKSVFESPAGDILYLAVLVAESGCQELPERQRQVMNMTSMWPNVSSWSETRADECTRQYQATPSRYSSPVPQEPGAAASVHIYIGTENCEEDNRTTTEYCNGPLKPGTGCACSARAASVTAAT